jgi:tetratricopeptide (TPR) repeat protein
MAPYLAMAFFNMALISDRLGNLAAALDGYTRAAAWRERLLTQQGREELAGDWAQCLAYKADMLRKVGRHDEAQQDARRAVAILQAEVARNERADLRNVLQWALRNLGDLL